jgi:PAS domain-containing protein
LRVHSKAIDVKRRPSNPRVMMAIPDPRSLLRILDWNPGARKAFRYSPEEVIGPTQRGNLDA